MKDVILNRTFSYGKMHDSLWYFQRNFAGFVLLPGLKEAAFTMINKRMFVKLVTA